MFNFTVLHLMLPTYVIHTAQRIFYRCAQMFCAWQRGFLTFVTWIIFVLCIILPKAYCNELYTNTIQKNSIHHNGVEEQGSNAGREEKDPPLYHVARTTEEDTPWNFLNEGLYLGIFTGVLKNGKEFEIVIVRIDPYYYDFSVHMASQVGKAYSLRGWSMKYGFDVAINASMYLPDGITSTGYLRGYNHINNNHIASKFGAFLMADPYNPAFPSAVLLDRFSDNWEQAMKDYKVVIQNYRLISADRKLLWRSKSIEHSIAAIARDGEGFLFFIHSRCPISDADFGEALLVLPIDVHVAMYVEGGSQAGLFVKLSSMGQVWRGKHPADILDIDNTPIPLPNVIGVKRKNK